MGITVSKYNQRPSLRPLVMERRVLSQVGADLVSRTDQMESLQWDVSTQAADSLGRWGVEERTRKEVVEKNRPTF